MLQLHHQNLFVLLFSSLFLAIFLCHYCSATEFIVGDSSGWVIPPNPTFYGNWSQSHTIRIGDSLEFEFEEKFYNLIEVTQSEYEHCTALEPIKVFNNSPVILPMKEKGVHYYICSVSNYCYLGQKIMISVLEQIAPVVNPPTPSVASPPTQFAPMNSPQSSPNGSANSTPGGSSNSNSGCPPVPSSSTQGLGEKFNAMDLACVMLGTFLGFWMIM